MRFGEIVGHDNEKNVLRSMVNQNKIPHALLLHGPSGIGKTRIARAMAQYINCRNRNGEDSCGECPACRQTESLNNPDIHYVYPVVKKEKRDLSEDFIVEWREFLKRNPYMPYEQWLDIIQANNSQPQIRVNESSEILRISNLSNYAADYKIFIIWLPEKFTTEAANKLLKIIEEPHDDTLFILISNDPGGILPTIRSRLTNIQFSPLSESEIALWLQSQGIDEASAADYARIAQGNLNKATELTDSKGEMNEFSDLFIDMMRSAYARNMSNIKVLSEKLAGFGREKAIRFCSYFSRMIRESFIANLKIDRLNAMTEKERNFTSRFSPFVHSGNVEKLSGEADRARNDISRNANQKIVWFDMIINVMLALHTKENK